MHEKDAKTGRAQRVIKHPLFRPFNSAQAEEYLGSQAQGDVVIRPSSKGLDHLAVTWKVSENVFQHIDVLELDKENEFSVGRTLKVGGKFTYSDLDELIVLHVKAMAKKVDEIMTDERFQKGSREATSKLPTPSSLSSTLLIHISQTNGSTPTPRPTPSAACTPSASTPNTPATSTSASKLAHQQRLQPGPSKSSLMPSNSNAILTLICARSRTASSSCSRRHRVWPSDRRTLSTGPYPLTSSWMWSACSEC